MKPAYKEAVTASGARGGHISSEDGKIDMKLSIPKAIGGDGGNGTNPEQLFAGAYSACFGSALQAVAKEKDIDLGKYTVTAVIELGKTESGFQLGATLDCYLPTVDLETGETLIKAAHQVCPFSKATRDNIDVTLNLLMDEE